MLIRLFVHQIEVLVRLPKELAVVGDWIQSDYSNFLAPSHATQAKIKIFVSTRPRAKLSNRFWLPTRYSQSTGFKTKFISVSKRLQIWIRGQNPYLALVHAKHPEDAYEALDRLLLSSIGELLDQMGIHRLHAFSFFKQEQTVIFTGGSGIGKSFLAAQADQDPSCRIFHDEVSLICGGKLLPLPMASSIEDRYKTASCRHFIVRKNGPKKWRAPLSHPAGFVSPVNLLVLASRSHSDKAVLKSASWFQKLRFILEMGLGIGQMQMAEFTLRADLLWHLPRIFLSRIKAARALVQGTTVLAVEVPDGITWADFQKWILLQTEGSAAADVRDSALEALTRSY